MSSAIAFLLAILIPTAALPGTYAFGFLNPDISSSVILLLRREM